MLALVSAGIHWLEGCEFIFDPRWFWNLKPKDTERQKFISLIKKKIQNRKSDVKKKGKK